MNRNAVGIVIALSIATLAATIAVSYGVIKVEAVNSDKWCYTHDITGIESICFQSESRCVNVHDTDEAATSGCSNNIKMKP